MASPQMDAIPTYDGDYDWLLLDLLMHERSAGLEPAISTLPSIFRGDFGLLTFRVVIHEKVIFCFTEPAYHHRSDGRGRALHRR